MASKKDIALDFLNKVVAGKFDEAYSHVDMKGKHHNIYTPAGFGALKKGMTENEAMFPKKKFDIRKVLESGDQVVTHSLVVLKPGELEVAVVHWFRFEGDKIVEMWDLGQPMPKDVVNQDGAF